ncbi:hypothetical protein I3843_14G051200 [Carya illinoinensis]|uniref:Ubiquinol-cytochrome c reductase complex 6.7 kDa protein n=1 Tax=Carya illinoinensis TaxID=32201 RepID=A0A8T1NF13_CARIL|nr:hypothetical protein I3760_14G051400 [Carya illinoinensis]KAG6628965.1 hypothetical protein CIPAW_14G049800 [Carya illinoinensis]KAG6677917.1 hypothetical protein I3842_14G052400 [Carya illinoinensis]KAG7946649.1 hypothetical protein I3843_14G051200 [Carya illinoinensis]
MAGGIASRSGGILKFLNPKLRLQPSDIQSAALWGVAGATSALWLVQPFNWLKKTFLEKPEPEAQ